jgi:2-polyprenyl-3-methyl-5-hydroxy-6-metoxy-1,4-benzoquinol methylase
VTWLSPEHLPDGRRQAGDRHFQIPRRTGQPLRRTLKSFGYEWTTFDDVREEDREFWETYSKDRNPSDLTGRIALDAGCGKGRFSCFLASQVRMLFALDGSEAVTVAARNLANESNALVLQGDLTVVPFRANWFGFISCVGVLHHLTPIFQ